ncbi:Nuclease-related domain-containing protein [Thermomonospora echinospora]|uniref:Nuclease-related domain-containing protein n=1 Tax=Thermomonospora echinospora TaxID=1992 RepID=A0A1H5YUB8_9ACTN|nr:nuclease-related domain-containing protein [Thermomonospora echinospora]SEG27588.1 Nuclease-related domain-containing protein [Thermomonospora echinospora]
MPGRRAGGGASQAGASARARYRMLAGEYRRQRIAVRLVLTAAVAVIVLGLAGWRASVTAAALAFVAHLAHTRYRPGPVTGWRRGALAERRTGRRLARLGRGYRVLHDRALPGTPATNLDHLVIGPTGVHAIVSRRWRPGTRLWADRRRMWAGRRPVTTLPVAAVRIARTVGELLGAELGQEVPVSAIVAVHGARLPDEGLEHRGAIFQQAARLPGFVEECPVVLTGAQVAAIAAAAERVLPPMLNAVAQGARGLRG